jgi:hypothetical protein
MFLLRRPGDICEVKWLTRDGQECTHVEMKLYKGIRDDGQEFGKLQFVRMVAGRTKNTGNFKWKIPMDIEEMQYAKITISHYQKGDSFEDQSRQFKILKDAPSSGSVQARPTGAKARKKKSSGEEEEVLRRMMDKMDTKSGEGTGQKLVRLPHVPFPLFYDSSLSSSVNFLLIPKLQTLILIPY